jgi:hypothetical protein
VEKSVHSAPAAQTAGSGRARLRSRRTVARSHSAAGELASGVLEATSGEASSGDWLLLRGGVVYTI